MKTIKCLLGIFFWSATLISASGQLIEHESITVKPEKPFRIAYKQVDTVNLGLHFYYPEGFSFSHSYPAIIFFHGGGWNTGSYKHFMNHAQYLRTRGIISVLAEYRIKSKHGTTPFEAVKDAKSAIRFLRKYAGQFYIKPDSIVAGGGSAGGHLAAVAGNIEGLEESDEDQSISSKPNALVLFNPVFDNSPEGYGYNRIGERYTEISPMHNISPGAPPTIVFFGTEDPLISPEQAKKYKKRMEQAGSRCDLFLYEGQKHGFFNYGNTKYYLKTVYQMHKFLVSLGYIDGEPSIREFENNLRK